MDMSTAASGGMVIGPGGLPNHFYTTAMQQQQHHQQQQPMPHDQGSLQQSHGHPHMQDQSYAVAPEGADQKWGVGANHQDNPSLQASTIRLFVERVT